MPFNRSNKFVSENISVSIPSGALYDTLYFSWIKRVRAPKEMLSDLDYVHTHIYPGTKGIHIVNKARVVPAGKKSKWWLPVCWRSRKRLQWTRLVWEYLTAEVQSLVILYQNWQRCTSYFSKWTCFRSYSEWKERVKNQDYGWFFRHKIVWNRQ